MYINRQTNAQTNAVYKPVHVAIKNPIRYLVSDTTQCIGLNHKINILFT